ncbi:hypothetical protein R1sor_020932 [Riccia sorocarpa]|uniref:ubiquitinyl hydrolase 1 n=1 Tax=Riccia sorocarpa TaxID=122646 RepID=A0ABD3GH25_9MARC
MHDWGDSSISAVFLAILIVVLISVGVAQQARARAARCQEIRRLQFHTAQEAQREEAEAAAEYKSMVATRSAICAICRNISNTRCSRCKSVRYCSAACQTLHWNHGHKQECRAPDPPSSGSTFASSTNFSDAFSRSSSPGASRDVSELSNVNGIQNANHFQSVKSVTSNGLTANGALSKPKQVLFPYKSFVKFFTYDRLGVPPCGLINCGNSCFANVVLQCLTYTRPLTTYLLDGSHGEKCTRDDWCFMCELQEHVYRVRQEQSAFSPIRILSRIRNIGNHLGYGRQEDAHEFMRFAIDSMQSTCLDEFGGEKSVDARSQETTLIHHIFGGHLQSQVQCMQCLHESNRYEKMMDLAVEIHGSVETLEDALAQFTAPEWLDGDNKYKCDRCNDYVKARKRLTLHEAPNILTVALKRFQSGKFGKLNKRVTFPEVLDMTSYMSEKGDRPPPYLLYAVVVHVDMLNASFFGHYICYVKDAQGTWYKIDDSKVKEVDVEKVMSQKAYMLFYMRSAPRPAPEMDGEVALIRSHNKVIQRREDVGVVEVYSEASRDVPRVEAAVGGTMGLHAMVEPRPMEMCLEEIPQRVKAHGYVNGEHAPTQLGSWERDIIGMRNDDEISVEESGCVARSSNHLVTSPSSSSHLSTEDPGVVRKVLVCSPDSSNEDDAEITSRDLLSPMSSDLADISLNVSGPEEVLTPKIGKRRLDEALTPLPTPKPLDTDQLPAWPANGNGRLSPSPAVCIPAANQMNGLMPAVLHSSRQSCVGDESKGSPASPASPASPVHRRLSPNQICLTSTAGNAVGPERMYSDAENSQSEGVPNRDEDLIGRAKRQHLDINSSDSSIMERMTMSCGAAQTLELPDVTELVRRDMSSDELMQQPGSPASVAVGGLVVESCADILSADSNFCAPSSEVPVFPSSLRQVLLEQQVNDGSTQHWDVDGTVAHTLHPFSLEPVIQSTWASADMESTRAMEQPQASSGTDYDSSKGAASLNDEGVYEVKQCEGSPGLEPLASSQSEELEASSIFPPNGPLVGLPQSSDVAAEEAEAEGGPTYELASLPSQMPHDQLTVEDCDLTRSTEANGLTACTAPASKQDLDVNTVKEKRSLPVIVPRPALKPLFSKGFLNRSISPVAESSPKSESNGTAGTLRSEVPNGIVLNPVLDGKESSERCNDVEIKTAEVSYRSSDQDSSSSSLQSRFQAPTSGSSQDAGNGSLQKANCAGTASSSGNHGNKAFGGGASLGEKDERGGVEPDNKQGHGEVRQRSKTGSSRGKRSGSAHMGSGLATVPTEQQANHSGPVTRSGKQKQGRNESCLCGSQRKWKKCCGKSVSMMPEVSKRRIII